MYTHFMANKMITNPYSNPRQSNQQAKGKEDLGRQIEMAAHEMEDLAPTGTRIWGRQKGPNSKKGFLWWVWQMSPASSLDDDSSPEHKVTQPLKDLGQDSDTDKKSARKWQTSRKLQAGRARHT